MTINIDKMTNEQIQRAVNAEVKKDSPRTVRNITGLLSIVLKTYRPDFVMHLKFPPKKRPTLNIPDNDQVKELLHIVEGTDMELPILLAAFGPMRHGEIAALRYENIDGNAVHVCENMVKDGKGGWTVKQPKTYAGDHYITYSDFVAKHFTGTTALRSYILSCLMLTSCSVAVGPLTQL